MMSEPSGSRPPPVRGTERFASPRRARSWRSPIRTSRMRVSLAIMVTIVVPLTAGCGPCSSDAQRPSSGHQDARHDAAASQHSASSASSQAVATQPSSADGASLPQSEAPSPPAALPARFAELGGPCPSRPRALCVVCNGEQRVVAVYQPGDFLRIGDRDAVVSRSPQSTDFHPRRLEWAVAVTDRLVSAQVLTCPGCRRQMGWAVMIDLAGLASTDPAVRRELQAALGWPDDPLLHDVAAWRASTPDAPKTRGLARDCAGGVIQAAAR